MYGLSMYVSTYVCMYVCVYAYIRVYSCCALNMFDGAAAVETDAWHPEHAGSVVFRMFGDDDPRLCGCCMFG